MTSGTDPKELMERLVRERGDTFKEFYLLAEHLGPEIDSLRRAAGYVHHYEGHARPHQALTAQMRELLGLVLLASKADDRFAANHVRRLYRLGVSDAVILDGAVAAAPVVGWSTVAHVGFCIEWANSDEYTVGELPPEGRPTETKPFAELEQGRSGALAPESFTSTPEWSYIAGIDPRLQELLREFCNRALLRGGVEPGEGRLGAGPRELIAIALLCARGQEERAARHIRRALALGMSRQQVLEAISTAFPMTGVVTLEIGARAMQRAEA